MGKETINIFCDGGARGNPGPAACAFLIFGWNGNILFKSSHYLGKTTNNTAEYLGVIFAYEWLVENPLKGKAIVFNLDSELVVKQLNGTYKVKDKNLKELFSRVKEKESFLNQEIKYLYVSRGKNKLADFLVNQKLDSAT